LVLVDITPFRLSDKLCGELRQVVSALQELQSSPEALESRSAAEATLGRRLASPEVVRFLLHNLRRGEDRRLYLQLGIEAITAGFDQACRSALSQTGPGLGLESGLDSETTGVAAPEGAWRETPLLTIRGGKSKYMPPEHFEALTNWFRMHTHITIKNAGHWLHVERQEEFVNAVAKILDI
jgi:pimeloyl-ACP methyl ester carboxylesterase